MNVNGICTFNKHKHFSLVTSCVLVCGFMVYDIPQRVFGTNFNLAHANKPNRKKLTTHKVWYLIFSGMTHGQQQFSPFVNSLGQGLGPNEKKCTLALWWGFLPHRWGDIKNCFKKKTTRPIVFSEKNPFSYGPS